MRLALPTLTLAAALALSGCSASTPAGAPTTSTTSTAGITAGPLSITSPWVKAAPASGMSAAFAMLVNRSGKDVTITGVTSPASTEVQLHVTKKDASGAMVMKEAKDGFTLKAGTGLALVPGGAHIMFMKLAKPLLAGDTVPVTLTFSDGTTATFTAPIREFTGAKETYAPSTGSAAH